MPTVLRDAGFSLMIYTHDHEPMHVHVWYQGREAIKGFANDVELLEVNGMNRNEARRALAIVYANRDRLIEEWRAIYDEDQ